MNLYHELKHFVSLISSVFKSFHTTGKNEYCLDLCSQLVRRKWFVFSAAKVVCCGADNVRSESANTHRRAHLVFVNNSLGLVGNGCDLSSILSKGCLLSWVFGIQGHCLTEVICCFLQLLLP